jgi:hypothetical protein
LVVAYSVGLFIFLLSSKNNKMINSKVINILKNLSKDEIKRFSDFVASPFFNKKEAPFKLLNVYKKYHPDFNSNQFTKEKVFEKIFVDKKYSDELFRNLNSDLLLLAENFLSQLHIQNDAFAIKMNLLSELNRRNFLSIFGKNFVEAKNILDSYDHRDSNYFYNSYFLLQEKDIYNSFLQKFSKEDIEEAQNNFLQFFVIKLLEMQNYLLYECRINEIDSSLSLNNKSLNRIFESMPEKIIKMPQIQIYYNSLKLEETSDSKYFENLKSLLDKFGGQIEKKNHFNKYIDMIYFIKRTKPKDDPKRLLDLFELRKSIVEKDLFMENFIPNLFFLNLVNSALTQIGLDRKIYK